MDFLHFGFLAKVSSFKGLTLKVVLLYNSDSNSIVKIGEGTYGEAFKAGDAVCKVVPIDGELLVNGEVQKVCWSHLEISLVMPWNYQQLSNFNSCFVQKSEEVLEEVLLSLTLNNLRPREGDSVKENSCTFFIETKE